MNPNAFKIALLDDHPMMLFGLIGDGCGTKDIATTLGISLKTVETHRENIKCKLGITRIEKLISDASRWRASCFSTDSDPDLAAVSG
ncbi:MAG: helix-turn-helix transcriptional regulator [Terrimicrobiaceae bacterium]